MWLHVLSLVRRNSNCCEEQNLPFCSGMSNSKCNKPHLEMTENHKHIDIFPAAPKPAVSLFHCLTMAALLSFVYIRWDIHFLNHFMIYLYVVLNFQRNSYMLAVWQSQELYNLTYHFILVCLPLNSVAELTCWLRWCALKAYLHNRVDISTVTVMIKGAYCG